MYSVGQHMGKNRKLTKGVFGTLFDRSKLGFIKL